MKVLASLILTFVLGAMFVSLFHTSAGMDMTGGMSNCPFMAHEEVVCPMNLADHIGAWKSAFVATIPTIILLLAFAGAVAFVASIAPHILTIKKRPHLILYKQLQERTYTFPNRPLQELFASGILHPKIF